MISYEGLEKTLKEKGIGKTDLTLRLGFSTRTIAKIAKGEKLSKRSIQKIAGYLGKDPAELMREVSDNKILQMLREEKQLKMSGGLYHELQVRMTYNSNHIEGSRLSEDQTRLIFETNTIDVGDGVPVDDILETVHHFRAIDYVIDTAEEELTEDIIKHLHYILKHDTKDSTLSWFAVGDYKKRANVVGGRKTVKPSEVHARMQELLEDYNAKENVAIDDIIALHAEFEYIHPFQDGNGRVGRLVVLKECLRHNVIPFIIEDSKKSFYYRGLAEWKNEKGCLTDTCLDGQDAFVRLLDMLEIPGCPPGIYEPVCRNL
ncbi:MAG: Fic family protein [Lachnospiraceae bacterium]|nr:Fic family protein [Lachnospiraceae bacterium]